MAMTLAMHLAVHLAMPLPMAMALAMPLAMPLALVTGKLLAMPLAIPLAMHLAMHLAMPRVRVTGAWHAMHSPVQRTRLLRPGAWTASRSTTWRSAPSARRGRCGTASVLNRADGSGIASSWANQCFDAWLTSASTPGAATAADAAVASAAVPAAAAAALLVTVSNLRTEGNELAELHCEYLTVLYRAVRYSSLQNYMAITSAYVCMYWEVIRLLNSHGHYLTVAYRTVR